MKLSAEKFTIQLPRPFRIAHGSSDQRDTILVHLHDSETGFTGRGEGALPPYYPSKAKACLAWLADLSHPAPPDAAAAEAALDIARHDLQGQIQGQPLWKVWELGSSNIPPSARTLSIPLDEKELREGFRDGIARGSRHFKLKLGSGDLSWDERCVRLARAEFLETAISVDANAGWSPKDAAHLIGEVSKLGLEYFEQPVAADWSAWRELRDRLGAQATSPLVADESIQSEEGIRTAKEFAHGVNIKLLKAGGLTGARSWIAAARAAGLRILLGGMVETGIGRSATAHLAPLADWLDIDPPDSIPYAPAVGYSVLGDRLTLSDRPGLGLRSVA